MTPVNFWDRGFLNLIETSKSSPMKPSSGAFKYTLQFLIYLECKLPEVPKWKKQNEKSRPSTRKLNWNYNNVRDKKNFFALRIEIRYVCSHLVVKTQKYCLCTWSSLY